MELIIELTGWRISITEIMPPNIIGQLPKEYDNPSEKVRKKVEIWMIPKRHWFLLLTQLSNKVILTW